MQNGQNNNGLAIAGLIVGICSIIFSFFIGWLGLILGIVGLILSIKGRNSEKKGMATGGLVCSIIGIVFGALSLLCVICAFGALGSLGAAAGL